MIETIINLCVIIIGLLMNFILFFRFPKLPLLKEITGDIPKISIIIPARNEASKIHLILNDLKNQTIKPYEIILVDDNSTDKTSEIANSFNINVMTLKDKPLDWIGKSWACHNGAKIAKGELLLFLDADVRLSNDGIKQIILAYQKYQTTISIQPYHITKKLYEQFSLPFNLIQICANGITLPNKLNIGLYGPIILIKQTDYILINGHESVKDKIVEDMALAKQLKLKQIPYHLYIGNKHLTFRMYQDGFKSLFQGWMKNIAIGAGKTPLFIFILIFIWIVSMASTPIQLVNSIINSDLIFILIFSTIYLIWIIMLYSISKKIGKFKLLTIIFYPILIINFFLIFFISLFKQIFKIKITWKDRKIKDGDKDANH